jgi:hypothetical protein
MLTFMRQKLWQHALRDEAACARIDDTKCAQCQQRHCLHSLARTASQWSERSDQPFQ